MIKIYKLWIAVLLCSLTLLIAQTFNYGSVKKTKNIISKIWFNFEGDEGWGVYPSKFFISSKTKSGVYETTPDALGDDKKSSSRSFGFQTAFKKKGYNYIDIERQGVEEKPFTGTVDNMSLWVWGGNFDYDMEVHVEDYLGYIYRLPLGNLKFYGWKNLSTRIPNGVMQVEPHAPKQERLKFKKFRLYANPYERENKFICVFDYFKIVTDTYVDQYDGFEVENLLRNGSASTSDSTATEVEGN